MPLRKFLPLLCAAFIIYATTILGSGCAQIGMPTGGLRDSLPPVLLAVNPPNKTLHFNSKSITLTFDEYLELKDLQNYLIVSPNPVNMPVINAKLKQIKITLRDTLQPNTTYSIQLGNAIQDINEGNKVLNFNYVFSTGDYIDSLSLSGNVELAQTGDSDSTLFAMLYNDLSDSAVYKSKPRYATRLDSAGNFNFQYLAPGTYHLFAIKDESGQKIYTSPNQLFAFANSSIVIGVQNTPVKLLAYAEEEPEIKSSVPPQPKKDKVPLAFISGLSGKSQDLLSPLVLEFNRPIRILDSTLLRLTDTLFRPLPFSTAFVDTLHQKIEITTNWEEDKDYRLLIDKGFATDTLGETLAKNDTLSFKTMKESEYGNLKINFRNLNKFSHPVLQILANNTIVASYPLANSAFEIKLMKPGDYQLRILDDVNQNGKWDPGNYMKKLQPEQVYKINMTLNIRANWENERDIEL